MFHGHDIACACFVNLPTWSPLPPFSSISNLTISSLFICQIREGSKSLSISTNSPQSKSYFPFRPNLPILPWGLTFSYSQTSSSLSGIFGNSSVRHIPLPVSIANRAVDMLIVRLSGLLGSCFPLLIPVLPSLKLQEDFSGY